MKVKKDCNYVQQTCYLETYSIILLHLYINFFKETILTTFFPFLPSGTHDIHALILGRAITGLQAFTVGK